MDHPFLEILSGDKRKVKRIELPTPVDTILDYLGEKVPVQLVNYSFTGVGLYVPTEYVKGDKVVLAESNLEFPKHKFQGQLVYQHRKDSDIIQVGFQLPQQNGKSKYLFRLDDPDWDEVNDEATVKNIYNDLVLIPFKYKVEIFQNQSAVSFYPTKITDSGTMIGEFNEIIQGQVQKGEAFCNFDLFQTYHVFRTEVLKVDDKQVEVKLSPKVHRLLRRETLRVEKEDREYELKVTLKSNILNQEFVDDQILDYSEHGISLIDYDEKYAFPKDMPIESIQIDIQGGDTITAIGKVRNYVWNIEKKAYILGLELEIQDNTQLTQWHDFILKARYPNIEFKYEDEDHQQIWNLFDRSGYLSTKPKESFDTIVDITKDVWKKTQDAGSKYSKRIQFKSDGDTLGHTQIDKLYPNTWCIHALAFDQKMNKLVSKNIYSAISDIFSIFENTYTLAISNSELTWNQKNYYDFVKKYPIEGHNELKLFHLHEGVPGTDYKLDVDENLEISLANKYELKTIQRFLDENISALEIEALAYNDDPYLEKYCTELEDQSLYRHRDFLVAKLEGEILGFAVLETGTVGVSVFAIQETMYLYTDKQLSEKDRIRVQDTLIQHSMEYYKEKNRPSINIYLIHDDIEYYQGLGFKYFMTGARWINKSVSSKRYNAFTNNLYGHLMLRREKIKKKKK